MTNRFKLLARQNSAHFDLYNFWLGDNGFVLRALDKVPDDDAEDSRGKAEDIGALESTAPIFGPRSEVEKIGASKYPKHFYILDGVLYRLVAESYFDLSNSFDKEKYVPGAKIIICRSRSTQDKTLTPPIDSRVESSSEAAEEEWYALRNIAPVVDMFVHASSLLVSQQAFKVKVPKEAKIYANVKFDRYLDDGIARSEEEERALRRKLNVFIDCPAITVKSDPGPVAVVAQIKEFDALASGADLADSVVCHECNDDFVISATAGYLPVSEVSAKEGALKFSVVPDHLPEGQIIRFKIANRNGIKLTI